MVALTYRPLGKADLSQLVALGTVPDLAFCGPFAPQQAHDAVPRLFALPETRAQGAFVGDRLVGVVAVRCELRRRRTHAAELTLAVHPDHQRRGVGAALLRQALDASDKWFHVMRLEIAMPVGREAILPWLQHHGFAQEVVARHALWHGGRYVDELRLARLRPGAALGEPAPFATAPRTSEASRLTIQTRPLMESDMPAIAAMHDTPLCIQGTLQVPFTSEDVWRDRFHAVPHERCLRLAAHVDGKICGLACLFGSREPRRQHAWSLAISIADAYHGRGVGSQLLKELLQGADTWLGAQRIELVAYQDNPGALALYERLGFVREGLMRAESWRNGGYATCVAMARIRA